MSTTYDREQARQAIERSGNRLLKLIEEMNYREMERKAKEQQMVEEVRRKLWG